MTYEEAVVIMKRGGSVRRGEKTYKFARGVMDVTDPKNPVRVFVGTQPGFDAEARGAEDWKEVVVAEASPETVAPEAVDEVLHETALDDEHTDTPQ